MSVVEKTEFKGYMGSATVKQAGIPFGWTKEMQIEYIKCALDPIYFAESYMKIVHVDHGLMTIPLYDYQKEIILLMKDNRYVIGEQCRQSGKTTAITAFVLWKILFHKHERIYILANKQETSIEILERIQLAYEHLPQWIQQGVLRWNKKSMKLENGSIVFASATGSGNIRGKSATMLIVDEAAHVDNWEDFYSSVFPVLSSGKTTKVVLISTVNGLNHFHDFTSGSRNGKNNYKLISIPWWKVPGRDEEWKKNELAGMNNNLEKFAQEYENEYLGSSGTLIAGWKLKEMVAHSEKTDPIAFYEHKNGDGLKQYAIPEAGHSYVIVADVSEGKGLDYSAFSVIDVTALPYVQVAVFKNNMIVPTEYAEVVNRMSKLYNQAMVLVELNNIGHVVVNELLETYENENILYTENAGKMGKRICLGVPNAEAGVRTTKSVKATGCSMIKLLIEQDKLIINDHASVQEFATFSRKLNSWEAEDNKHDDLVMGLVLFGWLTDQRFFKEHTNIDSLKLIRDKTNEEMDSDLTPFGIIDDKNIPLDDPMKYTDKENWKRALYDKGYPTDNWFTIDNEEMESSFMDRLPY